MRLQKVFARQGRASSACARATRCSTTRQPCPTMLAELGAKGRPDAGQAPLGVSARPRPVEGSYMPCFLAGVSAADGVQRCARRTAAHTTPTHQQGHIAAALYAAGDFTLFERESLVFHVSGGTTDLLVVPWGRAHHAAGHKQRSVRRTGCGPPRRQAGLSVPGGRLCQ